MQESPEAWDRLVIEPSACLYDPGGGLSEPRSFARRDPHAVPVRRSGACVRPLLRPAQEQLPRRRDDAGPDVWGSLLIAGPACRAVRPTSSQPPPQPSQVQGPTGLRDRGGSPPESPWVRKQASGQENRRWHAAPEVPPLRQPPQRTGPQAAGSRSQHTHLHPGERLALFSTRSRAGAPFLSGASSSTWNGAHEAFPLPDAPFPGDGDLG